MSDQVWFCRFHPTDWFHQVGCPHMEWTAQQLRDAGIATQTCTCESCGVTYGIGASPWCRDNHRSGTSAVEAVTWPGGRIFENLGHDPVRCDSPADLKREMDARGLMPFVRHVDGSPHTRSWATPCAYTMENGRVLAERQARTRATDAEAPPSAETLRIAREVFQR